jgi:hypothetical protein
VEGGRACRRVVYQTASKQEPVCATDAKQEQNASQLIPVKISNFGQLERAPNFLKVSDSVDTAVCRMSTEFPEVWHRDANILSLQFQYMVMMVVVTLGICTKS